MTIEISDTALRKLVFFASMSGVVDRLFRWPERELGCGFVVSEMIAQVSVLRDVREKMCKIPDGMEAERYLAVRRVGWYASGIPGSADFRKTVIDIMENDVVEGAIGGFFRVGVDQDRRAACA